MPGHLLVPVGDRLHPAVLRVRAAGLKGHDERLAGGVHDGVGDLEAAGVDPGQDLQADRGPDIGAGIPPRGHRRPHRVQHPVRVDQVGVADAQFQPVGGLLGPHRAGRTRQFERERVAQQRIEGGPAGVSRRLAVDPGAG